MSYSLNVLQSTMGPFLNLVWFPVDNTTENISDTVPPPVSHAMEDIEGRKSDVGVRSDGPQGLQEVEAERAETALEDRSHSKTHWEKNKHEREISNLQQVVDSLKSEVSGLKVSIDIKVCSFGKFSISLVAIVTSAV